MRTEDDHGASRRTEDRIRPVIVWFRDDLRLAEHGAKLVDQSEALFVVPKKVGPKVALRESAVVKGDHHSTPEKSPLRGFGASRGGIWPGTPSRALAGRFSGVWR